jgi:peptidyl-prolyl cis-trans isomerase B (cyclophilin B)
MPYRRLLAAATAISMLALSAVPAFAQDEERPHGPPDATPNPVPLEVPSGDGTAVRLSTEMGDVVIGLFNESAPVASENFLNLANEGFYDGVGFHRAVPGFVLQGGDPDGTGSGGPDYRIKDEEVVGQYGRGVVAMARSAGVDTQGSQFFIILDDSAEGALAAYNNYVIFGRVLEGMDNVDAIVGAREPSDRIPDPVRIIETSVEQVELPPEPTPEPPSAADLAAEDLAVLLPEEAGGYQLEGSTFAVELVESQFDPEALADLRDVAEANGADPQSMAIGRADGNDADGFVSILGATVPGLSGDQAQDAVTRMLVPIDESTVISDETIGGREVTRVELAPDPAPEDVAYVVSSGDVVWFALSSREDISEIIATLP